MIKSECEKFQVPNDARLTRSCKNITSPNYKRRFGWSSTSEELLWEVDWPKEVKAWVNVFAMHFPDLMILTDSIKGKVWKTVRKVKT